MNVISVSGLGSDIVGPSLNHAFSMIYHQFCRPAATSTVTPVFLAQRWKGLVNSQVSQEVGPSPRQVGWALLLDQATHQTGHRTKAGRGRVRKRKKKSVQTPFSCSLPQQGFSQKEDSFTKRLTYSRLLVPKLIF